MDNIILGLLLLCNRTIYQIRERIDKGLNLMFSSSMGSIQAAIKKLLNNGYIGFEEKVENGKYKKIYFITDSGRQHFFEWINSPMETQCGKFPELAKVYFMGYADKESREDSVQKHIEFLKEQYAVLNEICDGANEVDVSDEYRAVFDYQLASAMYGRDMMKFNINWFEGLLNKIRSEEQ